MYQQVNVIHTHDPFRIFSPQRLLHGIEYWTTAHVNKDCQPASCSSVRKSYLEFYFYFSKLDTDSIVRPSQKQLFHNWLKYFFSFFFLNLFRAAPVAYGSSQARGPIRAAVASLHHSHSNARSKPHLWPTLQLMAMLSEARDWTCILMDTSWVRYRWAPRGTTG